MIAISLIRSTSSTQLLLRNNTGSTARALTAVALGLAAACFPSSAHAELSAESPASDHATPRTTARKPKVEVLARASYGSLNVGMLQLGLEGVYMASPHLGFGGAVEAFYVDNGADPYYSDPGTLDRGYHGLAFVEGDLLDSWITPYARLALGAGSYTRFQHYTTESQLDFAGQVPVGLAFRGGPVLGRLWAAPSLYGKDFVLVYGAGIGGRF